MANGSDIEENYLTLKRDTIASIDSRNSCANEDSSFQITYNLNVVTMGMPYFLDKFKVRMLVRL